MLYGDARAIELPAGDQRGAAGLDYVNALRRGDSRERLGSLGQFARVRLQPFERQASLDQPHPGCGLTLVGPRRRTGDGENRLDPQRPERACKLEAVDPHASDGIRDQKDSKPSHCAAFAR
jgi:hypothetical protein